MEVMSQAGYLKHDPFYNQKRHQSQVNDRGQLPTYNQHGEMLALPLWDPVHEIPVS